jgi:site-specific DNA recombinase
MLRAVRYIRVSMAEQVDSHSLDAQRTSTSDFIAQRHWTFTGEYVDAGVSARSRSYRPALAQLIEDARRRRFDVVVVDKVDRFYRHLKGLLNALETLHGAGVTFVSVKENLDFTTPWGKLALTVLGMLAEIYIDNLSQETHKGKLARARKGLWNGSIPFGYCNGQCSKCTDPNGPGYCPESGGANRSDDKSLVEHPIEGEAVRRIFRWYLSGDFSDGDIADKLNADGLSLTGGRRVPFRTKGLPGRFPPRAFGKSSIRTILYRRFYTGVVAYYGLDEKGRKRKRGNFEALFPGQHPALVSVEDFERAQVLRRQFSRRNRRGSSKPNVHPLSGLLICDSCGRTMRAMTIRNRRYYRDSTRVEHAGKCDQPTLKAEDVERQVLDFIRSLKLPADWQRQVQDKMLSPAQQSDIARQKRQLEQRWARVTELYLDGLLSRARFQEEKWQYQADVADLHPLEITAIIKAGSDLEGLPRRLSRATDWVEINELLRELVAGVRVKEHKLTAVHLRLSLYTLLCSFSGSDGHSSIFK